MRLSTSSSGKFRSFALYFINWWWTRVGKASAVGDVMPSNNQCQTAFHTKPSTTDLGIAAPYVDKMEKEKWQTGRKGGREEERGKEEGGQERGRADIPSAL